jgi:tRNA (adenine22-N1)-methyltransferase
MISLSARLLTAASLLRGGETLIDVGTDHAYLPVYLVQNGTVPRVIASDIGEGPLKNAEKTVRTYGLEEKIELRLSDGLARFSPYEANEIVICGMGGNLIEEILLSAEWVKNPRMHLVLQPMTHTEDVRRYLCENGFQIKNEICAEDGGRIYLTLDAAWTGAAAPRQPGYYYFGALIGQSGPAGRYIQKQYARVSKRLRSIAAAGRFPEEQALLQSVLEYYYGETKDASNR